MPEPTLKGMWQNGLLDSFQGFGASFEARSCYQNTVLYFHNIVLGLRYKHYSSNSTTGSTRNTCVASTPSVATVVLLALLALLIVLLVAPVLLGRLVLLVLLVRYTALSVFFCFSLLPVSSRHRYAKPHKVRMPSTYVDESFMPGS